MTTTTTGIEWLEDFFEQCEGCTVDYIAVHIYACNGWYLNKWLDEYSELFVDTGLAKGIWLTEFCCGVESNDRYNTEGQLEYMKEAIPILE
eukprot:UN26252